MKKFLTFIFSGLLIFALQVNDVAASENISTNGSDSFEKQSRVPNLNMLLKKIGVPNSEIMNYEEKLAFYNSMLEEEVLQFESSNVKEYIELDDGSLVEKSEFGDEDLGALATISPTKLKVTHDVYTSFIGTQKGKRVYLNYEWVGIKGGITPAQGGTKGDKVGIAVPTGWNVDAQSYECAEFRAGIPNDWGKKGNCNGGTYELNFYGAVWSLTQTYNVYHKGWTSLRMVRSSTNAQNKVLGQYVEDTGKSTTWGIGWGPLSVSINGNKGNNKVSWDTGFTY